MSCPVCGVPTPNARLGGPALCLPCTEDEIGESLIELMRRVSDRNLAVRKRKWSEFNSPRERGVVTRRPA